MSALAVASFAFVFLFGCALMGMALRRRIPEEHLGEDSKKAIERGLAIIGTISGLVLGLLVASATSSYNTQRGYVIQLASQVSLLDRALAHYGPGVSDARTTLRQDAAGMLADIWPQRGSTAASSHRLGRNEAIFDRIEDLTPGNAKQTSIRQIAIGLVLELAHTRWLMVEQQEATVSIPLVVILLFWFSVTFTGLGIFAPGNATTVLGAALCALAVAGAMYIMLEMYSPFSGLLQIPSTPLQEAIARLGK